MYFKYVIIGASAAGISALQKLRQLDKTASILCISDEPEPPYNKCFLADYLGDHKTREQVLTKSQDFFDQNNITLLLNTTVISVDRTARSITCLDGKGITYGSLLLAVGGSARKGSFDQNAPRGLFYFYTLADTQKLKETLIVKKFKHVVVIGGGLTGLEVADAIASHGIAVTLLEQGARLLMRHADQEAADRIVQCAKTAGVTVRCAVQVAKLSVVEGQVTGVVLSDGTFLETTLVVSALGSQARLELAESAQLELREGGILTNEFLQTSDAHIWAAGDVAVVHHGITRAWVRTTTWPDAVQQGMYAACAMAGQPRSYPGIILIANSYFFGMIFYSAGFLEPQDPTWTISTDVDPEGGYARALFDSTNVVKGFLCLRKEVTRMVAYKRSLLTQTPFLQE